MNFLRFICTWPTQTKGNHTQYSECTCVLTGTFRELRRGLSCHAQAPSFRLWAGHSPVSPLQCSPAQVSGQSCCYTIIHMSAWKWSMCGNWVAVNGAWALLSKNVFQKLFYFRTHRLTWVPQSSCQEDHTDALTGHLLLLAEARLTRSQGDRRHILLLMPMCGKVSPLWLSLWNCALYSCFMIIKVLQWLVFLLASYNLRQRDS